MSDARRPGAFRIEPSPTSKPPKEASRPPRAIRTADVVVTPDLIDIFDEPGMETTVPPPASSTRRRSRLGAIFLTALGVIVSLGVGLWVDQLIRELFERAEWLGWTAAAVTAVGGVTLLLIAIRELWALRRLASVEHLRERVSEASARNDARAARVAVGELVRIFASVPQTAAGRRNLAELDGDIIDGVDLIGIAEIEILAPLDAQAKILVLDAAKRVSLVTAVSPRALVDIAYVVFEAARLVRRLAQLYGGRPGTLGFIRLARNVLAHLAVTGSIAAGDSFVQQIVGHGLAARLSAKLGEGVVNGMMTARIGLAAMDTVRPFPFKVVKRPGLGDFLSALATFARARDAETKAKD
ncbi:MAG: YcjF family protein [Rhizobiaceae bacterium]